MSKNQADHIQMDVAVVLGQAQVTLGQLLHWRKGSLLQLNKAEQAQDVEAGGMSFAERARDAKNGRFPVVDVEVNGSLFARAEVVTVAERFGVRLLKLVEQNAG